MFGPDVFRRRRLKISHLRSLRPVLEAGFRSAPFPSLSEGFPERPGAAKGTRVLRGAAHP